MSKEILDEILKFMSDKRADLRSTACLTVQQLTGTIDGLKLINEKEDLLFSVVKLVHGSDDPISENALKILINIASEDDGISALLHLTEVDIVDTLVNCIQNERFPHADLACGVLANMTRSTLHCSQILSRINSLPMKLDGLVLILCQIGYNKSGANLHLLASVIANFTQSEEGRREILNKERCIFARLLPFTDYSESKVRRKAIISAVRNCCFEKEYQEWLLSDEIDVGSRLALPLAGPDTYTPEESETLPLDLQYLPHSKLREEDAELRVLLLEAFLQLCSIRKSRQRLREMNIYLIFREYHKWEKDKRCLLLLEDLVNLLIKTEDEIGEDDLASIEVPADISQKFRDFDNHMLMGNEIKKK